MNTTSLTFSSFARHLTAETAFDVLAIAKRLKAQGKDIIELQIGDSPFSSTRHAVEAGWNARLAGRIPRRGRAQPSSPQLGLVGS